MIEIKKSSAFNISILLVGTNDYVTGITAGTITSYIAKNGGTFASFSPTITEQGFGNYKIALVTGNTDTTGELLLHFTEPRAVASDLKFQIVDNIQSDSISAIASLQGTADLIQGTLQAFRADYNIRNSGTFTPSRSANLDFLQGTVARKDTQDSIIGTLAVLQTSINSIQGTTNLLSTQVSVNSLQGTANSIVTTISSLQGTANLLSTIAQVSSLQGTSNNIVTSISSLQGTANVIYQSVSGTSAKEDSLQAIYGTLNNLTTSIANVQGTVNGINLTIGTIYGQTGTIYAVEVGQWTLVPGTLTYKFNGTTFKTFTLGTYNGTFGVFNART